MKLKKFVLKIFREIMRIFFVPKNIRMYIIGFFDKDIRYG